MVDLTNIVNQMKEKYLTHFALGATAFYVTPTFFRVYSEWDKKHQSSFESRDFYSRLAGLFVNFSIVQEVVPDFSLVPTNMQEAKTSLMCMGVLYLTNAISYIYETNHTKKLLHKERMRKLEDLAKTNKIPQP